MQYLVKHGDKFGYVSEVTSALGNYLIASVYQRGGKPYGITLVGERTFGLGDFDDAQAFADTIHPTADGMGEMGNYRCPAVIAYELGWS